MLTFFHFFFCAIAGFFTPAWQKDVRSISREVVQKLLDQGDDLNVRYSCDNNA